MPNLASLLEDSASRHGDREAVVLARPDGQSTRDRYVEVYERLTGERF